MVDGLAVNMSGVDDHPAEGSCMATTGRSRCIVASSGCRCNRRAGSASYSRALRVSERDGCPIVKIAVRRSNTALAADMPAAHSDLDQPQILGDSTAAARTQSYVGMRAMRVGGTAIDAGRDPARD